MIKNNFKKKGILQSSSLNQTIERKDNNDIIIARPKATEPDIPNPLMPPYVLLINSISSFVLIIL
ncbi:hypothetical protein VEE59_17820 [Escherichia coli]|nr:hypothetical protein VEE59_17820 [Escherichia coli]